ncbi:unnamed protein product [Rotaria socialis]|uniref:BPTI/Kunitz inhibitor domain-containing protein n=1 Tax=Rotaria socialis TaxID=392032 RepID=A0A820Z883_9BILA|nr:unnamed protein product [Rotaria socialis]CAF3306713.1 unnamed protein product [Rotaria socialis]CAF3343651.1 unnamed protein product [Rotaria socialis]CAF3373049.1 unnamed protein product [Rotaria socialis]CAF3498964.1 unnamed protein product [Rotaria socialis]
MLHIPFVLCLFISLAKTQYNYRQQQYYPWNNYNSWSSFSPNNPVWNQALQTNRANVWGNLLNDDTSVLPYGSRISVTLSDVSLQDTAARPLNTFVLHGSYRFPIAYNIPYSLMQVQGNNIQQYSIQARIEKDGQLLYINDEYTPVQLVPAPMNPINVRMKRVDTSMYPGNNGGIYTTRPPFMNANYICQLRPDPGFCYASIQQYYFDTQLRFCQVFTWGGCGGNLNRFSTRDECERTCSIYRRRITNNNAKQKWVI